MLNAESSTNDEECGGGGGGENLPSLNHVVSTSLARLHLLNAYRLSVHPDSQQNITENNNNSERQQQQQQQPEEGEGGGVDAEGGGAEEYRVRWEGHGLQVTKQVARLEEDLTTSDVTLQAKGSTPIYSHRMVLAAASPFFYSVLQNLPPGHHPVIVVGGASGRLLRMAVSFCYSGILTILARDIPLLLKVSEELEITGLTESLKHAHNTTTTTTNQQQQQQHRRQQQQHQHQKKLPRPSPYLLHQQQQQQQHNNNNSNNNSPFYPRSSRPPSPPTRFPFTPHHPHPHPLPHHHHALAPSPPHPSIKRSAAPPLLKDGPSKKKVKVEKEEVEEEVVVEEECIIPPHSSPLHHPHPPGSAPPFLDHPFLPISSCSPTPSFSPPNSAPPQSFRVHSPLTPRHPPSPAPGLISKQEAEESLRMVLAPSPLLAPHPHHPQQQGVDGPEPSPSLLGPLTPSTPSTPTTPSLKTGSRVLLWRFLLDLLHDPRYTPYYIRWLDRTDGIFRIMESDMVAQLWGLARKNNNMNYEKMSRGMRTYYKRGILFHIDGTKLIYRFNTSEPEIKQRMKFHDLTSQRPGGEGGEQILSNYLPSHIPSALRTPTETNNNNNINNNNNNNNNTTTTSSASFSSFGLGDAHDPLSRPYLYYPYLSLLGAATGKRELY
ncbi:hypothetical protein Pmani_025269 [Petrolisthes manimaculis]|uniref:BTB domain-containing protein n=1 Tax=Petrolisthes manimaculis TaxID=1843537 RepID=A0AAE1P836_9EUCA|nr:hypothetical protein Pmani_025269 [Petrolisthes manimaculis]